MSRFFMRAALILIICLVLAFTVTVSRNAIPSHAAGASMTLSATYGPPTTKIGVKGTGFKRGETTILTFDTTQVGKTTASTTGTFSTIIIPSVAVPKGEPRSEG